MAVGKLGWQLGLGMMMMGAKTSTATPGTAQQNRADMGTTWRGSNVEVIAREDPGSDALHAWDLLVDRTPGTDVTQLSVWGGLRGQVGFTPLYLLAYQDGGLVGGAQILTRRFPVFGSVGYLPYGPLVAPDAPATDDIRRAPVDAL